ncbi:hypothetical protein ACFQX7_31005 [Luedemannella flava]
MMRTIPAQRLGTSDDPREPRFWDVIRRSPALHLASRAVAHRTRREVGHVLLAAYAVALARQTGITTSVAQVLVSNRFRLGCADSVTQLTQPSIVAIDVADTTIDEVVRRAWKAATNAYVHGYFDTYAHGELMARLTAERGAFDISAFVNDRRGDRAPTAEPPTREEIEAAVPRATTWVLRKLDTFDGVLYVTFDSAPDAIDIDICADTRRLGPAGIEALAREIEAVAVEAAVDADAPTRVGAPVRI